MYLVDTNVIAEIVKAKPNAAVIAWIAQHDQELYLSSITIEEMRFGALALPDGKKRTQLLKTIDDLVASYRSRIWAFDATAAEQCAHFHHDAITVGRTPSIEDLMIAAIGACRRATVVTRNIKDFAYLKVSTFNPFE